MLALLAGGCSLREMAGVGERAAPGAAMTWQAPYGRDNPLVGRIWQPSADRFVPPAVLLAAAVQARFVLIGEQHDNPDHHALQAMIVGEMLARARRPAIAFEMLDADAGPVLRDHLAANPRDATGLGPAVGWDRRGWPDWSMYAPIAQAALDAGVPIVAADAAASQIRDVGRLGMQAMDPAAAARLGLVRPLSPGAHQAIAVEMERSHCGRLPPDRAGRMVDVQRLRDAHMADRMIAAVEGADGAVLIVGFGHARTDRGVPWYLRQRMPGARVASIALMEVSPGETETMQYALRLGAMPVPFDFVWFTPRVDLADPCEKFAPQLQRLGGASPPR